jgi:hypothetical protein
MDAIISTIYDERAAKELAFLDIYVSDYSSNIIFWEPKIFLP